MTDLYWQWRVSNRYLHTFKRAHKSERREETWRIPERKRLLTTWRIHGAVCPSSWQRPSVRWQEPKSDRIRTTRALSKAVKRRMNYTSTATVTKLKYARSEKMNTKYGHRPRLIRQGLAVSHVHVRLLVVGYRTKLRALGNPWRIHTRPCRLRFTFRGY